MSIDNYRALGTQADIVFFSIIRINPERQIGAVNSVQDLNVALSRVKEKLFIIGGFEMIMNGWSRSIQNGKRNLSRKLAYLKKN
jgi:superfamily I DNA and/or RNA helicase